MGLDMGGQAATDGELIVKRVLELLAANPPARPNDPDLVQRLIESLRTVPLFASGRARFSIDILDPESDSWYIAASTDATATTGTRYSTSYGLTGWALRTGRSAHLHFHAGAARPVDMVPLPEYVAIKSAFLWIIRARARAIGAICVVSDDPDVVSDALVERLLVASWYFKIAYAGVDTNSSAGPATRTGGGERLVGSSFHDWLTARLRSKFPGYEHAYFWYWDPRTQVLTPRALTAPSPPTGEIWPGVLRLNEGFVGRCAAELKSVIENRIDEGRGMTTGITSPYSFMREGVRLGSILTYPVHDTHRLHGVLAVVSEAPHQFEGPLQPDLFEIMETLREHLQSADSRGIETLQRELATELLNSLSLPDDPTKFWNKLEKILRQLEARGLCTSCALYVRKRNQPTHYSCKATSPRSAGLREHRIRTDDDEVFRALLALPEGVHVVERPLNRPPLNSVLKEPGQRYWVKQYPTSSERSDTPLFLTIAGLDPATPHHGAFGTRPVEATLGQVFTGVFAAARAILTASDNQRLVQERMSVFSAATHDVRGPIASLRTYAEALEGLTGDNAEYRTRILGLADEAVFRTENMLFDLMHDKKPIEHTSIQPWQLVADVVAQVNANLPQKKVIFLGEDSSSADYLLRGHQPSLILALKNVLDNAIKFGRETPVHVKMRVTLAEAGSPMPHKVTIEVRDHGIGIPVDSRKAIFERGYRTEHSRKSVVKGAGVGLFITRAIIEHHDGNIWVDSSISTDAGTNMLIMLPVHRRP